MMNGSILRNLYERYAIAKQESDLADQMYAEHPDDPETEEYWDNMYEEYVSAQNRLIEAVRDLSFGCLSAITIRQIMACKPEEFKSLVYRLA